MNRKKWIRLAIAAAVIIIIILAIGKKQGWFGKQDVQKISTEKVTKQSIIETVSANGKIQPETEVKVSPDISGEIIELYVKEGDVVKKGDILAKVDPEIYQSNYDQSVAGLNMQRANEANSKARLAQVQAQYNNIKLSYNRDEMLYKKLAISASEYDASKAAFESAQAEVEAAAQSVKAATFTVKSSEAALQESRKNLTKTTIYAPVDGSVSKLNVEKGERVVGTSQFSSGTEIMRIANLGGMEVNVSVNENDIDRVHLGDTALIEVDAFLNRKFKGIVTEVATSANIEGTSVEQVTNFDVKIRVLRESYTDLLKADQPGYTPLRPGMSATVDIQTETVKNVLTLPIQAVTTRKDTSSAEKKNTNEMKPAESEKKDEKKKKPEEDMIEYVFVYDNGIAKLTRVKSGIQDNVNIQIKEGLKEGDEVIVAPYKAVAKTLKNNEKVKKVNKSELFAGE